MNGHQDILLVFNIQTNIEVGQGNLVYLNKVSVLIQDVCIPMFVIFTNTHQINNCLHYVYLYILASNYPNGNVIYNAVAIILHCCFQTNIKTHFTTLLLLNSTTTKDLNVPSVVIFHFEKSTSVWNVKPFMSTRVRKSLHQEGTCICWIIYIKISPLKLSTSNEKFPFNLHHVKLLGKNNVGKAKIKVFKRRTHKRILNSGNIITRG